MTTARASVKAGEPGVPSRHQVPAGCFNGSVSSLDGSDYQAKFDALAAEGVDVHGEARFVLAFDPRSVLDAGCGTGRVAIELAHHGVDVVGVEVDGSMIAEAQRRAPPRKPIPTPTWVRADLAGLTLGRRFDVVLLAGNVPLFCPPDKRSALVESCAAHVAPGGVMVAGFSLDGTYALEEWDTDCAAGGLVRSERWSTWDREPYAEGAAYAVSVHARSRAEKDVGFAGVR